MALTTQQESDLLSMLAAYQNGEQIDDLPAASMDATDKKIEVFDTKSGASQCMDLTTAVDMANAPWCGRVWRTDLSTPTAETYCGSLEMLRNLADILGLGCYLVKNDHSRRKLDPTNHYRFANGETAKLDGSMGHYQWGWNKPFYYAKWTVGVREYQAISLYPIKGQYNYRIPVGSLSATGLAALDRTNDTLVSYINDDAQYRGGNNTPGWDGTYRTLLGRCATNRTTAQFAAAAHKNGAGWLGGTMRGAAVVKILVEIIMGTRNVQAAYNASKDANGLYQGGFGTGVTNWNGTSWNNYNGYNPFLHLSAAVDMGDGVGVKAVPVQDESGTTVFTANVPVFFGLKNFFGYIWRVSEDELAEANADKSMKHWIIPSIYETYTYGSTSGMSLKSTSPASSGSYIKKMSRDNLEMWPTEVGGSESTYEADYFWNGSGITSGFRAVFRGASTDSGGYAGCGAVSVSGAVTYANASIGSPLCEFAEEFALEPEYYGVA